MHKRVRLISIAYRRRLSSAHLRGRGWDRDRADALDRRRWELRTATATSLRLPHRLSPHTAGSRRVCFHGDVEPAYALASRRVVDGGSARSVGERTAADGLPVMRTLSLLFAARSSFADSAIRMLLQCSTRSPHLLGVAAGSRRPLRRRGGMESLRADPHLARAHPGTRPIRGDVALAIIPGPCCRCYWRQRALRGTPASDGDRDREGRVLHRSRGRGRARSSPCTCPRRAAEAIRMPHARGPRFIQIALAGPGQ
jgi:hypothetical protein